MSSLLQLRKEARSRDISVPTVKTMRNYGLTEYAWLRIMETQGWKCPICLESGNKTWNIDHFHIAGWRKMLPQEKSKYVRGILCAFCNYRHAPSKMNSKSAKNLASYLAKYEKRLLIGSNLGQLCPCHGVPMQRSGQNKWRCSIARSEWNARRRDSNREKVRQAINEEARRRGGCLSPGCDWIGRLEWHHRDPSQKKFNVGESGIRSITAVKAEMVKCDLFCPNHHSQADAERK